VWLSENYKWLFDGVAGAAVIAVIGYLLRRFLKPRPQDPQQNATLTAQGAKVVNSPIASGSGITQRINSPNINLSLPGPKNAETPDCDFWLEFDPKGSRPLHIQNNGTEPAFDVVVKIPADGSGFTSDVINRLNNDGIWVPCGLKGNFVYLDSIRAVIVETILRGSRNETEGQKIPVLISYRTRKQPGCEFHLEIRLPLRNGIQFGLPQMPVEHSLDETILQFLEEGTISENVPFTGSGARLFRAGQIAGALSLPKDAIADRLTRLEMRGKVQRHEGNLEDSSPRWSIVRT
jgi:hypothetical protein